jgi:TatD DNase family protein
MEFIDTHAHLYSEEYKDDYDRIIKRAYGEGVTKIIMPAIDNKSHKQLIDMATQYPDMLYPLMGLHPTSVNKDYKKELSIVEDYIFNNSYFKGVGEVGIDMYWDKTYKKEQIDAFSIQIKWAIELKLPIIIHTRDSFDEAYNVLKRLVKDEVTGIFHCFGGDVVQANKITDMGFYLGIGGVVTFKNTNLREILTHIDLGRIVLETDSPYLTPVPYRGKRNESSYVKLIAQTLSNIYGCSIEDIAHITTKNALNIFSL